MEYPIYWSGDPGPFPIKTTDACEGTYSVLLTDSVYGVSVGVGVQQTAYYTGAPPIGVSFCYKYKSTPNDTAQFISTIVSNTYASSVSYSFNPASVWTPVTIYFASYNGPNSDAFQLDVIASCSNMNHVSIDYSQLKIDNINFVYATGVDDFENRSNEISIYPNPNDGIFTLKSTNSYKIISAKIVNTLGQTIHTIEKSDAFTEDNIDLSSVPKGVYFVVVQTDSNSYMKKMVLK